MAYSELGKAVGSPYVSGSHVYFTEPLNFQSSNEGLSYFPVILFFPKYCKVPDVRDTSVRVL